ncbi:hypothetical protein HQN90_05720 [Paenibacillus alba]|uniref:hypothetical protein n=1 Tax=Paenibacillus alba TaxID=1197127 RepID=UPI00156635C5|nr:hypothetical protein [Paenibacillus alba]NQX65622.1 hypothetical protein [Paenibacillus alba]
MKSYNQAQLANMALSPHKHAETAKKAGSAGRKRPTCSETVEMVGSGSEYGTIPAKARRDCQKGRLSRQKAANLLQ